MASKRYVVARAEELPDGARKIVSVGNREIGVFNIGDRYYALRNSCPHKNGPLCRGRLRPLVVSPGVYQIDYQQEGLVLKCPWHQWEFDLA
ncbi:MAG: Rieske 2Fe-2S domain-containing protein, partial [Gemmatimonadetes bacterium]|nr:Rieske 2Fe-2S domain-containing protein [Gemmatimonadota bacterium]